MHDSATIAWSVLRAGLRLASDAVGDVTGSSLPIDPVAVAQPATLTALLNKGALLEPVQRVTVNGITVQPVPSVSSNCVNQVLSIAHDAGSALPDSLFVKIPMPQLLTRWFLNVINAWELESYFFRHVAPGLPIRTPMTYATAQRGSRFYLIQENLRDDPGVVLFVNPDMQAGPSLERVHACLDTFARLHAHYAGRSVAEREALLPLRLHPFLSRDMGSVAKMLNSMALGPCMKRRPGAIPPQVATAYRTTIKHWPRLLRYWFAEPLTLLHGDSHLGNFFVSGDTMGMLDWQAAHWGNGIRDVQYFLIDSLPAPVLAEHEQALVDFYVARRAYHGSALDPSRAWEDYRSFTFHTLMTIVVSVGFGALSAEQARLMEEILDRAVAAVERVDYPGWLAAFLDSEENNK